MSTYRLLTKFHVQGDTRVGNISYDLIPSIAFRMFNFVPIFNRYFHVCTSMFIKHTEVKKKERGKRQILIIVL